MNPNTLSFCCVVKNEEKFIESLINSLLEVTEFSNKCEFIFVDDFSEDSTLKILQKYAEKDSRFKILKNVASGKISGTNIAVSHSQNDYIKFIDGDDLIEGTLKDLPSNFDCLYHDYNSLSDNKKKYIKIGDWINKNPIEIQRKLRSIPKAMYIFKRSLLKKYFPIPEALPFEDIWINLIAAEANTISYYEKSIYVYRQHENQYYGSLENFNRLKRVRMANRFINYFDYLESNDHPFNFVKPEINIRNYAEALLSRNPFSFLKLIFSPRLFLKALFFSSSILTRLILKIK